VVEVDMCVPHDDDKLSRLEMSDVTDHTRQQSIASNVEWNSKTCMTEKRDRKTEKNVKENKNTFKLNVIKLNFEEW